MFSTEEKRTIAEKIEKLLLELNHPEMPEARPSFSLHVGGAEGWSWADIEPNWTYGDGKPETSPWNENARDLMKGE